MTSPPKEKETAPVETKTEDKVEAPAPVLTVEEGK
jgi:hypothetical protein